VRESARLSKGKKRNKRGRTSGRRKRRREKQEWYVAGSAREVDSPDVQAAARRRLIIQNGEQQ